MKQILFIFCTGIVLFACSKKGATPQPPVIDYSSYKLKTIIHSQTNYSGSSVSYSTDTSNYIYSGTSINYFRKYNGFLSDYRITLENGLYTQVLVTNNTVSPQKTYYRLNAAGLIDSNWISNNSSILQTSSYRYHPDGRKDIEINDYLNYKNIKRCRYQNDIVVYSLNERVTNIPSIAPAKDSVVYEYTVLPLRADFFNTGMPVSVLGKPDKHLLKKATYYDQLNNNAIRQTMEYAYKTNDIGLITQKIQNLYIQPGSALMLTDTTNYTYDK